MENSTEQNLVWVLIRSSIPAKLVFAKTAEHFGLTHMQLLTLCLVNSHKEGPAMQAITTTLGCDASNVTGLVDKLVNQGFLERSESLHDRRAKVIKLTKKGEQTRSNALYELAQSDIFNNLTPKELNTLIDLLGKLQSNGKSSVY